MKRFRMLCAGLALLCTAQAQAHGGLADLSVYDRTEGRRLPLYWHEGRAYVVGRPGNEYQITLRNRLREELLAVVSVDSVNVISGETANPGQSGYVLGPVRSLDIQGWRKNMSQTAAFYFTSLPDSYAARTGRPDDVGVIGVALFRKKQEPQPMGAIAPSIPSAKREAAADSAAGTAGAHAPEAQSPLGTGHGRREESQAQYVAFERAGNSPAETLTLYYDSYANLVARGIVRKPVPVAPLPRPFPGFVPDPRG